MTLPVRYRSSDDDESRVPDPVHELERLTRRLHALLDESWRFPAGRDPMFTPLADVEETADAYLVEIELPGVDRRDIDVELAGRRLSVRGERKAKERTGILRRRERTIGRFAFEVTLPGEVDEGAVDARLSEGVLTIRLPKPERDQPRRIQVT